MASTHDGRTDDGPGQDDVRPGSQTSLRSANERRLIDALMGEGELTQAQLSRRTGLAPATVSNIVHALDDAGVVEVTEGRGRKGRAVRLAGAAGYVVGIDFAHRSVSVALSNLAHDIVVESRPLTEGHRYDDGLALVREIVDHLLARAGAGRADLVGAAMTLPAPVDSRHHQVGAPSILPGWVGVDAPSAASRILGFDVRVDNDANLAAKAEHLWGAGRGVANLAYIKIDEGVGAGLVLDGQLFRGASGTAGEIGHTTIDEFGRLCRCGNRGCLETVVSTTQVLAFLAPTHGAELTIPDVVAAARGGDVGCRRILADTGRAVGVAVANLCNLINPELVLIGGALSAAEELLLDPMREIVARYGVPSAVQDVEIRTAALGDRAELLGAVALALKHASVTLPTATPGDHPLTVHPLGS